MRAEDRTGLAVMISVLLASFTIAPLTQGRGYLALAALLIAVVGGLTIVMRRARLGGGTIIASQLLAVLVFSLGMSVLMPGAGEPWFEHYPSLWSAGISHMQTQASPMDVNNGVTLIFVTVIGLIQIMTDLLVDGINRPAWAIAPPAALFLVPAAGLGFDTGVASFACIAVGYLAILVAGGLNSTARWTRGLSRDSAEGSGTATPVVWRAAGYLAAPAVVATLVLGAVLPTLTLPGIGIGNGPGGSGPLQLTDPALDLRRNLNQPQDQDVIEYRTSGPGGLYLRLASLPQLSAAGWTNVQIRLNDGNRLPDVPGLSSEPSQRRTTDITVLDFGSQYLPLPYAPRSFEAAGDWRFDPNSLIVVNRDSRASTLRNLRYRVESVDTAPDGEALSRAGVGTPSDATITREIPADLPDGIIRLTEQVTEGADTPAAKAAAIQAYLRSDGFTYSKDPLPGSGYQALENFLLRDRQGYCEQFAAAMATMARVAGIPSRVSVGFLPGDQEGDVWKVSIRDMHAWPELYFAGYGWVRFEPTPASVTGSAPPWTVATDPSGDPSASASSSASASASAPTESTAPTQAPLDQPTQTQVGSGFPWVRTLLTGLGALVLLVILAAPATIRVRRRTSRLNGETLGEEQVEAAWAEIRDTVLDYGGTWPGGSPKSIGLEVASGLGEQESESMSRVATLVERSRYARTFTDEAATSDLTQATTQICHGLAAPASPVRRLLATLFPRSVLRRPPKL